MTIPLTAEQDMVIDWHGSLENQFTPSIPSGRPALYDKAEAACWTLRCFATKSCYCHHRRRTYDLRVTPLSPSHPASSSTCRRSICLISPSPAGGVGGLRGLHTRPDARHRLGLHVDAIPVGQAAASPAWPPRTTDSPSTPLHRTGSGSISPFPKALAVSFATAATVEYLTENSADNCGRLR